MEDIFTVELRILPGRDGESVSVSLEVEKRDGDGWRPSRMILTNSGETRKVLLDSETRLTIEGQTNVRMVFDKEQNAARRENVPAKPSSPSEDEEDVY